MSTSPSWRFLYRLQLRYNTKIWICDCIEKSTHQMLVAVCCFYSFCMLFFWHPKKCTCGGVKCHEICKFRQILQYKVDYYFWKICTDEEKVCKLVSSMNLKSFFFIILRERGLSTICFFVFNFITNHAEIELDNPDYVLLLPRIVGSWFSIVVEQYTLKS